MFTLDVYELTRLESGKVKLRDTDAKPVFQHLWADTTLTNKAVSNPEYRLQMTLVKRQRWKIRRNSTTWVKSWIVKQQAQGAVLLLFLCTDPSIWSCQSANKIDFSRRQAAAAAATCWIDQKVSNKGHPVPSELDTPHRLEQPTLTDNRQACQYTMAAHRPRFENLSVRFACIVMHLPRPV